MVGGVSRPMVTVWGVFWLMLLGFFMGFHLV
jgi:hypothetical protein